VRGNQRLEGPIKQKKEKKFTRPVYSTREGGVQTHKNRGPRGGYISRATTKLRETAENDPEEGHCSLLGSLEEISEWLKKKTKIAAVVDLGRDKESGELLAFVYVGWMLYRQKKILKKKKKSPEEPKLVQAMPLKATFKQLNRSGGDSGFKLTKKKTKSYAGS